MWNHKEVTHLGTVFGRLPAPRYPVLCFCSKRGHTSWFCPPPTLATARDLPPERCPHLPTLTQSVYLCIFYLPICLSSVCLWVSLSYLSFIYLSSIFYQSYHHVSSILPITYLSICLSIIYLPPPHHLSESSWLSHFRHLVCAWSVSPLHTCIGVSSPMFYLQRSYASLPQWHRSSHRLPHCPPSPHLPLGPASFPSKRRASSL